MRSLCLILAFTLSTLFVDRNNMCNAQNLNKDNQSDGFVTISLGSNCHTADFMRAHGIRFFAGPFDWCITTNEALYRTIATDFENFFMKENLIPHIWNDQSEPNGILDKQTGIFYNHDFPGHTIASIDQYYATVYSKYQRRIQRLYESLRSGKHVYLIRYLNMTKAEACELMQLLKLKFPNALFTLIVIGNNAAEFDEDWGIPHIKNLFIYCEHIQGVNYMTLEENPFWSKLCKDILSGAFQ